MGETDYFATPFFTEKVKVKSGFTCADFDAVGFFGIGRITRTFPSSGRKPGFSDLKFSRSPPK